MIEINGQELSREDWEKVIAHLEDELAHIKGVLKNEKV